MTTNQKIYFSYFIYSILFIFFTTNFLSVDNLINEANQADIISYRIIYENSPNFPYQVDELQKHVSQRFLIPYLVGYLSYLTSIEVEILFKIFVILTSMLIAHIIYIISNALKLNTKEKIIYLSLFIFNPYLIRYYFFNYIQLQDLIFLYFSFLFIFFFIKEKDNPLIIVSSISLYLKQSGLALIITSIFLFLINKKLKSLFLLIILSLIIFTSIKILSTNMTSSPFPIGNVINIFSYNFFDLDEIKRFLIFLSFPLLSFFPLLIFFFGKIKFENFNIFRTIIFSLPIIMLIGQPILGGPDIGKNLIRLTSLSFPFLLSLLIYQIDLKEKFNNKIFFFSFISFLHIWSMHPTFSIIKKVIF